MILKYVFNLNKCYMDEFVKIIYNRKKELKCAKTGEIFDIIITIRLGSHGP